MFISILRFAIKSILEPLRAGKYFLPSFLLTAATLFLFNQTVYTYFLNVFIQYFENSNFQNDMNVMNFSNLLWTSFFYVLQTAPMIFILTSLCVAIVQNYMSQKPYPLFVLERALQNKEITIFKDWFFFMSLLALILFIINYAFFKTLFFDYPWPFLGFSKLINYLWIFIDPYLSIGSFKSGIQSPPIDFTILIFKIIVSSLIYIAWAFIGFRIVATALGDERDFKTLFSLLKSKWLVIALTIFAIDAIMFSASIPLKLLYKYLRVLEIEYRFPGASVNDLLFSETFYVDYFNFIYLFLVFRISAYMFAFSKIYLETKKVPDFKLSSTKKP